MGVPILSASIDQQVAAIQSGVYSTRKINLPTSVQVGKIAYQPTQVQESKQTIQTVKQDVPMYYSRNNPTKDQVFINSIISGYDEHIKPSLQSLDSFVDRVTPLIPLYGPLMLHSQKSSQKIAQVLTDLSKKDLPGYSPAMPGVPSALRESPGWNTSRAVGFTGNVVTNLEKESHAPTNTAARATVGGLLGAGYLVYHSPRLAKKAVTDPVGSAEALGGVAVESVLGFEKAPLATAVEFWAGGKALGGLGKVTGKGINTAGIYSGMRRMETFAYKNPPHHPVASQAWQLEQIFGRDTISGARGTVQTAKGTIQRILGKEEQWTRTYKEGHTTFGEEGQYMTIAPFYNGKPAVREVGQYFIDKGTGAEFPVIGPVLRVARGRVHEVNDIPTVASEFTFAEREAILAEWGRAGRFSQATYEDIIGRASAKSARLGQPVAVPTPKHAMGSAKPELEAMMIFGSDSAKRITGSRFVGFTDTGVPIRQVAYGSQKLPTKTEPFFVDNLAYNLNYKTHYTRAASVHINRYLDEISGRVMTKPGGQFGPHGKRHIKAVEQELLGLRSKSPTIKKAVTPSEAKTAAFLHDSFRVFGGETELLPHGEAVGMALREGLVRHPRVSAHSGESLDKIAGMVEQHTRISPGISFAGLKTKTLFRPTVEQKAFASADRLARAQEEGFVRSGKVFTIPEDTLSFKIGKFGRESIDRFDNIIGGREPAPIGFRTEIVRKPTPAFAERFFSKPANAKGSFGEYYKPGKGYSTKGYGPLAIKSEYSRYNPLDSSVGDLSYYKPKADTKYMGEFYDGYGPSEPYEPPYKPEGGYSDPYRRGRPAYGTYRGRGRQTDTYWMPEKPYGGKTYPRGVPKTLIVPKKYKKSEKTRKRVKKSDKTFGAFAFMEFLPNMPVNKFLGM